MNPKTYWIYTLLFLLAATAVMVALKRPGAPSLLSSSGKAKALAQLPTVSSSRERPAALSASTRFAAWAQRYKTVSTAERVTQEPVGLQLAAERRAELRQLIQTDPRQALESAIGVQERNSLPATITRLLEEPVSGRGDYSVIGVLPAGGALSPTDRGVTRHVVLGGRSLEAFVYGRRVTEKSRRQIPLHGITIDGLMAVAESPLRVLEPSEEPDPAKTKLAEVCEISGKPASPTLAIKGQDSPVVVEVGNEIHYLCSGGHVLLLEKKLVAQEEDFSDVTPPTSNGVASGPLIDSPYTVGQKAVLYIRVRFANQPIGSEPETFSDSNNTISGASAFLSENSYGKTWLSGTVTPVYVLPHDEAWYNAPENDSSGFAFQVLSDARAVAANPSAFMGNEAFPAFDYAAYDFEVVRYSGGPGTFSGQAFIGTRGIWLKSDSAGALAHELGHNYGLSHANRWSPMGEDVIGPGSNFEYGDVFDTMGQALGGHYSFNAGHRSLLGWLPAANIQTIATSGTYRVYAFDQLALNSGQNYLLKVHKDAQRDYWGEFRQQWPDNRWTQNGLQLRWSPWSQSDGGSQLLDTHPGNNTDGPNDSAVVIGRTFSDPVAGIYFTPVGKGGTDPESLDVVVNLGTFPDNHAPTAVLSSSSTTVAINESVSFSVNAVDPDGDTLAYDWEFENGTVGPNAPTATASWSTAGQYRVLVTVSDMKGKSYVGSALVQVGPPSTLTISGRVTDNFGQPAVGVRVYNGLSGASYRAALTDSEGNYALTNLNPGVYPINAVSSFYTALTPVGFTNPVNAGTAAVDFVATQPLPTVSVVATQSNTSESLSAPGVFTFFRQTESPLSEALAISFSLSGSAAFDGSDYSLTSGAALSLDSSTGIGTLTIPAGATSATIQLNAIDDSVIEGTETATLTLNANATYTLSGGNSGATINIADNDAPDYTTEFFNASTKPFDLNGHQLTFTPVTPTAYRGNFDATTHFPSNPTGGTLLCDKGKVLVPLSGGNPDDGFWQIDLPGPQPTFFGNTYTRLFINTNGSITFNQGDPTSSGNLATHFTAGRPRIAAYWRDLDLSLGGTVSYRTLNTPGLERNVVTFQKVPFYGDPAHQADVQIELWASGVITLTWLESSAGDPTVGLAPGLGSNFTFYESDLSRYPPLPPSFNTWRATWFTPTELENPSLTGETADYDGDGLNNLLEYALGRDPKTPDGKEAVSSSTVIEEGQQYLTLTFERSVTATDIALVPEFGSDLRQWSHASVQVGPAVSVSSTRERATFRDTIPISASTARFGRLEVTKP